MGELAGAVVLGVGATITPCILPLYPPFLASLTGASSGERRFPPAAAAGLVWAGVVVGMVAIGAVFAALAAPLGDFIRVVLPVADGLLILLGVLLLLGRDPFARLPQLSRALVGVFGQLAFFLAFCIGCGLPLFAIGLFDQVSGARLARAMVRWEPPMQLVLGAVLVAVGLWDLSANLPNP